MIPAQCARGVDGLGPPGRLQRDRLLCTVHPTVAGPPRHGGGDVGHRGGRGHRPVVVQRHACPRVDRVGERLPAGAVRRVEHRAVEQITPVVVLKRRQRDVHAEPGGPVEMRTRTRPAVLEAPAVIAAEQAVPVQGVLIGIQREIQRQVAVGVKRHLPAFRGGVIEDLVELGARVVHRVRTARGGGIDAGGAGRLGVQVGKRDRDVAHPG